MKASISLGVLFGTFAFCAAAGSPADAVKPEATTARVERANQVLGREVRSGSGQRIAQIEDVLVNLESGSIACVVLDLERSQRDVIVPASLVSPAGEAFRFGGDAARLTDAPVVSGERISPALIDSVHRHFGRAGSADAAIHGEGLNPGTNAVFVRDLVGMSVRGVSGGRVGKVETVALDLPARRLAYVVLAPDRALNFGERLVVLPPSAFKRVGAGTLSTHATLEQLSSAPAFKRGGWPEFSNRTWGTRVYRHFGQRPYFESERLEPTSDGRPATRTNALEKIYHEPGED